MTQDAEAQLPLFLFAPPVDRLLSLGENAAHTRPWPDYMALGLGNEHVPDLIAMATDPDIAAVESEQAQVWAPLHAWRALGQLRAAAAAEPLVRLLGDLAGEDDWAMTELPIVLGMLGHSPIPKLTELMQSPSARDWPRIAAVDSLIHIAEADPETRDEVIPPLMKQLAEWPAQDPGLNAFLIDALVELMVGEASPLMEQAFAADRVDVLVRGDWEDVQVDLGLLAERRTPPPRFELAPQTGEARQKRSAGRQRTRKDRLKAKRKLARQSKRRNRRRK